MRRVLFLHVYANRSSDDSSIRCLCKFQRRHITSICRRNLFEQRVGHLVFLRRVDQRINRDLKQIKPLAWRKVIGLTSSCSCKSVLQHVTACNYWSTSFFWWSHYPSNECCYTANSLVNGAEKDWIIITFALPTYTYATASEPFTRPILKAKINPLHTRRPLRNPVSPERKNLQERIYAFVHAPQDFLIDRTQHVELRLCVFGFRWYFASAWCHTSLIRVQRSLNEMNVTQQWAHN